MSMFGANIYLLIALLIVLSVAVILIIATWTLLKIWIFRISQRRAQKERRRERHRPDGEPYPPASRGICHRCGRSFPKVYHLPSGMKLCPEDYDALPDGRGSA